MTQKNDGKRGMPEAIEDAFLGGSDEQAREEELIDGIESGASSDAEAMVVSLKTSTHGGDDCVEVYAHGEAYPEDGVEKTQQTVLLARVTERALTMFPLVSASYRPEFLTPKYDELTTITILADEDEPWWLPETIQDFDGMLESLPTGFGRHAKYGLGFKWEYRLVPHAILEMHGITELVIEPGNGAVAELPKFRLGIDRFSAIKRSIDSITARSRSVQQAATVGAGSQGDRWSDRRWPSWGRPAQARWAQTSGAARWATRARPITPATFPTAPISAARAWASRARPSAPSTTTSSMISAGPARKKPARSAPPGCSTASRSPI